jgi:hypothetical protein
MSGAMQTVTAPKLKNGSFTRTYGAPSTSEWPRFFMDSIQDIVATERNGRPIFTDVERVEINFPGNPHTKPVFAITDEHRQKWPDEYAAFRAGQEVAVSGTPLEQWSVLKRSQVLELKALGFQTIEHLAGMNDHAMQRIPMFGRRLKELAEAYLDDAKAMAAVTAAQAEADQKDTVIAALQLQVENMQSQMQQMFSQMQDRLNTPNPLATNIPGMSDPIEMMKYARPAEREAQSSFADLPAVAPRRKRRTAAEMAAARGTSEMDAGGNDGETESGLAQ